MKKSHSFLLLALMSSLFSTVQAQLCQRWSQAKPMAIFDTQSINESSGLAVSRQFPERLYHINDSGDGPYFYMTDFQLNNLQKIEVENFKHEDMEDLGYESCLDSQEMCLYLADIGDNRRRRESVQILEITEQKFFASSVPVRRAYQIRYPDRPRDAEAFAVHPNGDFYLLTKEEDQVNRRAWPARLYRLSAKERRIEREFYEWELLGQFDLPWLMYLSNLWGQMATSMDISADGQKLLILTYHHALELNWDLSDGFREARSFKEGKDFQIIKLEILAQQEAIAYLSKQAESFLYTTEWVKDRPNATMMSVECETNAIY